MKIKTNKSIQMTFFLLLSILLCYVGYSQSNDKGPNKLYLQAAAGGTNKNGSVGELGIQGVLKNNWVASLSYHSIDMDPKNLPSDFEPGATIIFLIPIAGETPSVDMKLISVTMGRYFNGGRNLWFTTEAGLSFVNGKKINFSKYNQTSPNWAFPLIGEIPANYSFTGEKKSTMGVMLKADANWAFSSFAGLGAGFFANLNSIQSPVGFQIKLIVGKMNRAKKK